MNSMCRPPDEDERLAALMSYQLLDTPPDPRFDSFTKVAARVFEAPTSLISLVDGTRAWFKSRLGLAASEAPREHAFCAHALMDPAHVFVVDDMTLDPRFADNPLVRSDPSVRFYAGAPLVDGSGHALGTLCVIDSKPRHFEPETIALLADLADGVVSTMGLHRSMLRMHEAATSDPLTGLANRTLLSARLDDAVREARAAGTASAVLCLDLDRFKAVNDLFGHAGGDALLREAAARLQSAARGGDVAARLGGDEFAVLATGLARPEAAEALARRILDRLAEPFEIDGQSVSIRGSVGIAFCPRDAEDAAGLLARADAALYRAKRDGRGRVEFYTPAIGQERRVARLLERDLRIAVDAGQFTLAWQPIVRAADGRLTGYETLLRWNRPGFGPTPPASFIGVAESLGLICRIDRWVLREACRQAASWPQRSPIAVNVSAQWFHSGDLPSLVADVLAETDLEPGRLEIEVTERTMIDNEARAQAEFARLQATGVRVVLDDFGAGYSSLAYLVKYRFDKIKLGGVFVADIGRSKAAEAVVRAVLQLCATLGLTVCAEEVETQEQLAFLRAEGCAEVQGFLTGAALAEAGRAA